MEVQLSHGPAGRNHVRPLQAEQASPEPDHNREQQARNGVNRIVKPPDDRTQGDAERQHTKHGRQPGRHRDERNRDGQGPRRMAARKRRRANARVIHPEETQPPHCRAVDLPPLLDGPRRPRLQPRQRTERQELRRQHERPEPVGLWRSARPQQSQESDRDDEGSTSCTRCRGTDAGLVRGAQNPARQSADHHSPSATPQPGATASHRRGRSRNIQPG